jgi:hypothetical protein
VEQHCARHWRRVGVARARLEAEDHELQVDADLRRGEDRALRRLHRPEQVGDESVRRGVSKARTGCATRSRRGSPIFRISRTATGRSTPARRKPIATRGARRAARDRRGF